MGARCMKTSEKGGYGMGEEENIDRKKKDIKNFSKDRTESENKLTPKVMMDIAISDVDKDFSSSHKPSLAGLHRGSSLAGVYLPQGTIRSMGSHANQQNM
tara:strand:+ start:109 stop:408 length:300 start_codon:yes stop_codon:yes gene_type:complete